MASEVSDRKPRAGSLKAGLAISAFTLLLLLGGLELAGYLWERSTAQDQHGWTLVASRRLEMQLAGDEAARYTVLVPERTYNWEGIDVEIGAQGFRSEVVAVPKPEGTFRILNLGDSVAFGWEVAQSETYGKLLEAQLNESGGNVRVEVLNAGVPTWNMETERNFLLQKGLSYEPDLIILAFSILNDVYGTGVALEENPGLMDWLRDETYLWPFLTTELRFLMARQAGPEAIPVLNPPKDPVSYFPLRTSHQVYDRTWGFIEDMAGEGTPILLVLFPTAFQLNSVGHPDTPQQALTERAAGALTVLDLLPIYRAACAEAGPDACEGYENHIFADVWMHPNPLGHEIAAREILKLLEGNAAAWNLP